MASKDSSRVLLEMCSIPFEWFAFSKHAPVELEMSPKYFANICQISPKHLPNVFQISIFRCQNLSPKLYLERQWRTSWTRMNEISKTNQEVHLLMVHIHVWSWNNHRADPLMPVRTINSFGGLWCFVMKLLTYGKRKPDPAVPARDSLRERLRISFQRRSLAPPYIDIYTSPP